MLPARLYAFFHIGITEDLAFGFLSAIMMVHLLFIPLYHMAVRFVFMIDEKHFLLFHSIADEGCCGML